MDFQTAVRTCFNNYVTFSGRAQRSQYWWFALFGILGSMLLSLVDGMMFGFHRMDADPLSSLFSLAILLPSISVGVRRLHDRDKSGWWLLIGLIPLIGFLVLVFWFVQRGTVGPNRFGPDPLGETYDQTGVPPVNAGD